VLIVSRQPGPSLRDALPQPSGEPIGDRFVLVGTLGEGGMGKVLAYDDRALERRVAVKILRDKAERGGAEALMREAQVLGGLAHPNILPVYDIGEDPEAGLFYVMPLVEQPTLEEALTALREGKTSHGRMLRLFIQVCQAIAYAHSRGVFHCDLKPPNVLLGSFGEVFVADWGFAHREGDTKRVRGGTPGYMPPEQLQKGGRVGPYTDVFALGVILYQLLTDKLPFPFISFDDWDDALKAGEPALAPAIQPSERAKDRSVPPELDELCMRAIELDPTRRLSTATELATALESFLEGTKEKRRRQKRAADLTEQGSSLRASYEDLLDAQEQRERELTRLRAQVAPWASTDEKEELWHAEDGQFVIASLSARTFQTAVASLESAIEEVPDHASARAELANLYALEHERATVRRADLSRKHFEALALDHDDGQFAAKLDRGGSALITADVEGAEVFVLALEDDGARLVPGAELARGAAPLELSALPVGRYLLRGEVATGAAATVPLFCIAGRASTIHLSLTLPNADWAHVPGGAALLGGHPTSVHGAVVREVEVEAFDIQRLPVTMGEYLTFLEHASKHGDLDALLPRDEAGAPLWEWRGGPKPATILRFQLGPADLRSLPVFGVDLACARSYAAWLSERRGERLRLPSDDEWEKAARGVDGRPYPWGDRFDAALCKTRVSRDKRPAPEPVGVFSTDASPYGVLDLAGGVAEWVESSNGAIPALRGGSWADWPEACHAASRRPTLAVDRATFVGFRLVRAGA
jgi:serine/threonine protein kinase/formylglycine-generating enzyme required for sulfatase activity